MADTLTREQIESLMAAADKATPGPWERRETPFPIGDSGDSDVALAIAPIGSTKDVFTVWWDGLSDTEPDLDFIAAANPSVVRALCAMALASLPTPTHRHNKTGGLYQMIGGGAVQSERPLTDMQAVVIYRSVKDGTLWAREFHEFHDANRFTPLTEGKTNG